MHVRLAMTGFGNVGRGVATLLLENRAEYRDRYGVDLVLTAVADQGGALLRPEGVDLEAALAAKSDSGSVSKAPGGSPGVRGIDMLSDSRAQIFIEASSTNFVDAEPSWSAICAAQRQGMHVVLASKGALVLHFKELMDAAASAGTTVSYSATVGAPLPALEIMGRALAGTPILGFAGLVNGTANVILQAMLDGKSYDEGVRVAQEMGIAETDPTLDVDGWDAAAKAAILANTAFGANLTMDDVDREGIRALSTEDLEQARQNGDVLKLVSRGRSDRGRVSAQVRVERRNRADPLGRLRGSEMGIVIQTAGLGDFAASVENAHGVSGGIATAATVLRDIINLAREQGWNQ
jgi:homoserine dehydrogenase